MSLVNWMDQVQQMCDRSLLRVEHPTVEDFIALMQHIKGLYPYFFSQKIVLSQLQHDIQNGIDCIQRAMSRLGHPTTVLDLIRAEIRYHNGQREKCQDRKHSSIVAVLWLNRVLWFISAIVQVRLHKKREDPIQHAYALTLRKYHTWLTMTGFQTMVRLCTSKQRILSVIVDVPTVRRANVTLQKVYAKIHRYLIEEKVHFEFKV